jgi:PleD family two-component response regulator
MRKEKPRSKSKELKPPPAATVKKTRVLLVDDHPTMREGLIRVIERETDLTVCKT